MEDLHQRIFLPSLRAVEANLILCEHVFEVAGDGSYQTEGWHRSILLKNLLLMEAVVENLGEVIGFLDVDIVFLKPFMEIALACLSGTSLAAQSETREGGLNSGCMFMHCSLALRDCFAAVLRRYTVDSSTPSQELLAQELVRAGLSYKALPPVFSNETNGSLTPDSVLYHANLTFPGHHTSVSLKTRYLEFAMKCRNSAEL